MKKLLIIFFSLLTGLQGWGDTRTEADSLLRLYEQREGTQRTQMARQIVRLFESNSVFFGKAPQVSESLSADELNLVVWFAAGRYLTTTSYYKEAMTYIERALPLALKLSKGKAAINAADCHATLLCDECYCLFKLSDYARATAVGQEAVELSQRQQNLMQLSRAYLYLAIVNHGLRNYDDALVLVEKAIATNEADCRKAGVGQNMQTHNVLGVACELFCSAKQLDKAVSYGLRAVEAARAIGYQPGVANHLTQLSYAYDRKGEYDKGLKAADQAIDMVRQMKPLDRNQLAISLEFKGWNLIDMGRHGEAAAAMREAIEMERAVGNTQAVCYDYRTLSEALEPIDLKASMDAMKTYVKLKDSLHTEQLRALTTKANAELHVDELEQQNAQSRRMNRIIFFSSLAIVLMLVVVIAALAFAFRQKKRSAAILQRLTRLREEFFTNVTHEFRTPLTVILGVGQELQKDTPPKSLAEVRRAGVAIERQGLQLLTLVNQLLDISKVKSALGQPPLTQGSLKAHVAMVVERYQELARQHQVNLRFEADDVTDTHYVADYVEKMVGNLLSNAIKFTPSGGSVEVVLRREGNRLRLSVSDTGCGIPEESLPHIFEPFYQGRDTDAAVGTGVGLALVKQIVDALHGQISATSTPQEGTTFTIMLPASDSVGKSDATGRSTESPEPQEPQKPLILVVEDNADVAALIGQQLADRFEVHYAADGRQGIAEAQQLMPSLIITDLMMPHTDGLQLCRTIRQDAATSHIPVIMVTAKATEEDRIRGRQAGADVYLYKPFNADELNICVQNLIEAQKRLRKKLGGTAVPLAEGDAEGTQTGGAAQADGLSDADSRYTFTSPSLDFIEKVREAVVKLMAERSADVEHVSEELCISQFQLRSKLTALTGQTPMKFILSVRLEHARRMLAENPERTIADVGESCGFYDKSHFAHSFRDAFGMTPGNYVKMIEKRVKH